MTAKLFDWPFFVLLFGFGTVLGSFPTLKDYPAPQRER
jgi:hypothetical protein